MNQAMIFDTHVHTTISACSRLQVQEILDHAQARGLDGVCITDHDTMGIRHVLTEGVQANGLCVIFGMEYATRDGDFLIFGPFEELQPGLDAGKLLPLVREAGGAAIAAHPFRPKRSVNEFVVRQGLCSVVERINGRNSPEANERSAEWFERYDLAASGGSDAHSLEELGVAPSRILARIEDRGDFVRALQDRRIEPLAMIPA